MFFPIKNGQHCKPISIWSLCGALAVAIWKWKVTWTWIRTINRTRSRSHKCVSIWPAYYLISFGPLHWQAFAHSPRRLARIDFGILSACFFLLLFGFCHLAEKPRVRGYCLRVYALCLGFVFGPEKVIPEYGNQGHQSYKVDRKENKTLLGVRYKYYWVF